MNRKLEIGIGLGITLTGTMFALSFQHTITGAIAEFPFPGGSGPGFVQIQQITLKPGDSTGWHRHDGPSWVILERGRGVIETEACGASTALQPGTAFAEPPDHIHKVDNYGPGEATINWATVYPQGSTPIVPEPEPICAR
ncbi:MAG: cupin domain-containing protein [Bryobacteraceae bacterium]